MGGAESGVWTERRRGICTGVVEVILWDRHSARKTYALVTERVRLFERLRIGSTKTSADDSALVYCTCQSAVEFVLVFPPSYLHLIGLSPSQRCK